MCVLPDRRSRKPNSLKSGGPIGKEDEPLTASIRFLAVLMVGIVLPTGATAYYLQQRLQDVNNTVGALNNQVSQLQEKVSQLKAQVDRLNRTSALTPDLPYYLNVCVSGAGQAYHAHAHLSISINGAQQAIPGDVGRNGGCLRPLHTHSADGVIHLEPDSDRTFKLGDFFLVWNQPFNATQFMSQKYSAGQ